MPVGGLRGAQLLVVCPYFTWQVHCRCLPAFLSCILFSSHTLHLLTTNRATPPPPDGEDATSPPCPTCARKVSCRLLLLLLLSSFLAYDGFMSRCQAADLNTPWTLPLQVAYARPQCRKRLYLSERAVSLLTELQPSERTSRSMLANPLTQQLVSAGRRPLPLERLETFLAGESLHFRQFLREEGFLTIDFVLMLVIHGTSFR